MKKTHLLLIATFSLIVGCKSNTSSIAPSSITSSTNQSSTITSSQDVYSEVSTDPYIPSIPSNSENNSYVENPSNFTTGDFKERLRYFLSHLNEVHTARYEKRGYVKPSTTGSTGTNEVDTIDFTYHNGPMLTGIASKRYAEGIFDYKVDHDSGYQYNIQAYAEDGYLLYLEKLPRGVLSRISRADISKNNRYNNLYTTYNCNVHTIVIQNALDAMEGTYENWYSSYSSYDVEVATITVEDDIATYRIEATRPDEGHGTGTDYFSVSINNITGDLIEVGYGFRVYDVSKDESDLSRYQSVCDYKVSNITYGGREDFTGRKYTEEDVDKVFGLTRTKKIDYSSFNDGVLSDDEATLICKNLEAYASGTTRSEFSFDIPQFVDIHTGRYGVNSNGEYIIDGSLTGSGVVQKYSADFVEITGTLDSNIVPEGAAEISFVQQFTASDEGVLVIESYDNLLMSHKHTIDAKYIDDVDNMFGVNGIYHNDAKYPLSIIGKIGINVSSSSPYDDEYNTYTCSGTVTKEGNTLIGKITNLFCRNVFTPHRTFSIDFKVEDGFLSEYSFTESTYLETDSINYNFNDNKYSFKNYQGEYPEYNGDKLDPSGFVEKENDEGVFFEKESLYV